LLEPDAGKLARPVLRRVRRREAPDLSANLATLVVDERRRLQRHQRADLLSRDSRADEPLPCFARCDAMSHDTSDLPGLEDQFDVIE
jgi:SAM-dependent MidA family methyltransferase